MGNAIDRLFDAVSNRFGAEDHLDDDCPHDSPDDHLISVQEYLVGLGDLNPDPDDVEEISRAVKEKGIDVIAFYKSKRYLPNAPFPGRWGIFYLKQGLDTLSKQLTSNGVVHNSRETAYFFIRAHENYHYQSDIQTLVFELTRAMPLHGPTRRMFGLNKQDFVEEAIANYKAFSWALKTINEPKAIQFIHQFMSNQPGAYARFEEPIADLRKEWAVNVLDQMKTASGPSEELGHWLDTAARRLPKCPEYVVLAANVKQWIDPFGYKPPLVTIIDGQDVVKRLSGTKYRNLKTPWEETKRKLLQSGDEVLGSLDFKRWKSDKKFPNAYSVRVDKSNRAHLNPEGKGVWTAYIIGSHQDLGHG